MPDNSIQSLLASASQQLASVSGSADLDAEVLLCHCLNKTRSYLRTWPEKPLDTQQLTQYTYFIGQRQQGVPVAYLTGQREFWSRSFKVSPAVLIPRPDSELLVELALALLPVQQASHVLDLGTGSGILAITLAAERPQVQVLACDISDDALVVAQDNAQQLGVSNVQFILSNWFTKISDTGFDLIVSNPPYIAADDPHLQQGDVRFEPSRALVSADSGLQDIRLLAEQARRYLKPAGHLLIEHGYDQPVAVQAIFAQCAYQHIQTHRDLTGNPRVTSGVWNPQ